MISLGGIGDSLIATVIGNLIHRGYNNFRYIKLKIYKPASDIRIAFSSILRISKGDNIADVSNQLGHHSVKLTLDTYYHWIPGKLKNEVDALDDLHLSAPQAHPEQENEEKVSAK